MTDRVTIALLIGHPTCPPSDPLTSPDQIPSLPWAGNYFSDSELFRYIAAYILNRANPMHLRQRALYLMVLHGMGEDEPISEDELAQYEQDARDAALEAMPPEGHA